MAGKLDFPSLFILYEDTMLLGTESTVTNIVQTDFLIDKSCMWEVNIV